MSFKGSSLNIVGVNHRQPIKVRSVRLSSFISDAVRFVVVTMARDLATQEGRQIEDIHKEVNGAK